MTLAMWVLLLLAVVLANGPFLSVKWFWIITVPHKHFGHQSLEWVMGFGILGVLAYVFEAQTGPVHVQNWEFFVTVMTLYAVLAFPAFVWRYFWKAKTPKSLE